MDNQGKKRLGEKLIESGYINANQLDVALREHSRTGELLGRTLLGLGFITQDQLYEVLFVDLDVPRVELSFEKVPPGILQKIDKELAARHMLIPISLDKGVLTVAMANPYDVAAIDQIQHDTGYIVDVRLAPELDVKSAILRNYGGGEATEDMIDRSIDQASTPRDLSTNQGVVESSASIIELVDQIIEQGIEERATDIHIEPEERLVRSRYRIDGILRAGPSLPKGLQPSIASRIKIMSNLDISESRLPQDGRISFLHDDRKIDIRVSTYPTAFGENVVMRVLDKLRLFDLYELGIPQEMRMALEQAVQRPQGIILVTGPTGSGKTTTMYSLLKTLNAIEKNIITIEDPIEYELSMVRQSQINLRTGMTFPIGLRAILRQDPDVIMVGEVRDLETAKIAVSAALTGHLVLSSLHTNSAAAAMPRLMDMGIEPFLVSSALVGVLAARLIRTVCPRCKEVDVPNEQDLKWLGVEKDGRGAMPMLCHGQGCEFCGGTGYKGRTGIYEFIPMDETFVDLIMARSPEVTFKQHVAKKGIINMLDDGRKKALEGVTTIAEVIRVLQQWAGDEEWKRSQ